MNTLKQHFRHFFATTALLLLTAQGVWAATDYTMLLDPSTMSVGQTVGENLIVKQDNGAEKYVTATSGKVGWLEIPVNIGSSFEIRITLSYQVYLNFYGATGSLLQLITPLSYNIDDVQLIAENGIVKVSLNGVVVGEPYNLNGTVNRIVISSIVDGVYVYAIKTRGVQTATSCPNTGSTTPTTPTGNCTAQYSPVTGRVVIPCVAVPVTPPFGGAVQILNYSVEMQQRSGTFIFDLDLNSIKEK